MAGTKKLPRIYRLADAENPPTTKFINVSGAKLNTVHPNDFHYYEEVNNVVKYEPNECSTPRCSDSFASIGMRKGKPFSPDDRMKKILTEAGSRKRDRPGHLIPSPRNRDLLLSEQRLVHYVHRWRVPVPLPARRSRSRRTNHFMYYATAITPAMA